MEWTPRAAGVPKQIVLKLNREIDSILKTAEVREPLARQGAEIVGGSPEQLAAHMAADIDKWRKLIADAGLRFE
jgi:tripartite-type tricarboxylate transporter receptor subunit TctC